MRSRPCRHLRRVHNRYGSSVKLINADVPQKVRKQVLNDYFVGVRKDLKRSGRVRIPQLGILRVKTKKARPARKGINPFTKQQVTFKAKPASKVVKFRPAKELQEVFS